MFLSWRKVQVERPCASPLLFYPGFPDLGRPASVLLFPSFQASTPAQSQSGHVYM